MGIKIVTTRDLPEKLQSTIEREPDFVKIVKDEEQREFILHIEFQVANEPDMVYRMAEYRAILQRKYKLSVRQFVIYLGSGKPTMKSQLEPQEVISGFTLATARNFDPQQTLNSNAPEEVILSILGDYSRKESAKII